MKKLLPAILKTCRQYTANARLSGRVLDVVGAMHLKVPPGRQLMQPHVHAVITLDKDANAAFLTQQLQQLTHRTGAQNAAGPCQSVLASCEHQYYAKIKVDSTSVLTGRPCASRDEMTFVRLRSLQEYVQRFGSRDDPISADLQRSDMMKDADLRTHLACSRCQAEKAEAPCSYVSTTHYLVLPLTGAPFEIPADDRKVAETQMRTEAHLLLQDALNGRLAM